MFALCARASFLLKRTAQVLGRVPHLGLPLGCACGRLGLKPAKPRAIWCWLGPGRGSPNEPLEGSEEAGVSRIQGFRV